jgi:hypothetical protein
MNYVLYWAQPHYYVLCHFLNTLGTGYLNCLYAYKRKSASPVLNVLTQVSVTSSRTPKCLGITAPRICIVTVFCIRVMKMQITQSQFPILLPWKSILKITQLPISSDFHLDC